MRFTRIMLLALASVATMAAAPTRLEQTRACKWDVFRYCRSAIPNETRIAHCLKANLPKLGKPCQAMFR